MKKYTEYLNSLINHLPFSYHWILRRVIGNDCSTILDLGCGDGVLMNDLIVDRWNVTGVELYKPAIKAAERRNIYKTLVSGDVSKLNQKIKLQPFDVVFSSQVIEHLPKRKALKALDQWESLKYKKIIIATTVGFLKFHRVEMEDGDKNPLQKHLSGWKVTEFEVRGYKVYGQGFGLIYGDQGLIRKWPKITWPFLIIIAYLMAIPVYFFPEWGTYLIAVKNK